MWFVLLQICYVPLNQIRLSDLTGFNNTGNVCVWPSEDCLSQYCLENLPLFQGKSIIELGGGMTSLCGLTIASCGEPKSVLLTDGNQTSVENLKKICSINDHLVI
jgi:calmodulin-lysine N-methyltransferase